MNAFGKPRTLWGKIRKPALTMFLAPYLVSALIIASPHSAFRDRFSFLVRPILDYVGLYHDFSPYAPEPPKQNKIFTAVITFADGTTKTWVDVTQPGRLDARLSRGRPWDRWRHIFWQIQWNSIPKFELLYPGAARYTARLYANSGNQPTSVSVYEEDIPIVARTGSAMGSKLAGITKMKIIEYTVTAEDLQ